MSDFAKDINVPTKDIVYRHDVENMLQNALPSRGMWEIEGDVVKNTICETVVDLMMDLEKLPSVQPEPKWRPIKARPMDEEERQEWSEKLGYDIEYEEAVIYSNLPDDGEEVIICYKWGNVCIDTFRQEEYGCYFEGGGDMDGVIAWMPLPEPYKGEQE